MKKPKVLYHASQNRDIEEFEPRNGSVRDPKEGPVVFATSSKAIASGFLVPMDNSLTAGGRFRWTEGDKMISFFYWVCGDREKFDEADKGGAIYLLPAKTFECNPDLGLGELEWTSKVPVKPLSKKVYRSGLEAMLENEVNVFFVDKETFNRIQESEDHGYEILSRSISENQKRGLPTIKLK